MTERLLRIGIYFSENKMKTNIFRDIEISTLVLQGISQKEAGERFEISASRVHQIVYRTLRRTMNPKLGLIEPISDYYPISEARKHKHMWIDRLDVLRRFKRSEMNNTPKNLGFITGDANEKTQTKNSMRRNQAQSSK